jgi:hypothetical protein
LNAANGGSISSHNFPLFVTGILLLFKLQPPTYP